MAYRARMCGQGFPSGDLAVLDEVEEDSNILVRGNLIMDEATESFHADRTTVGGPVQCP